MRNGFTLTVHLNLSLVLHFPGEEQDKIDVFNRALVPKVMPLTAVARPDSNRKDGLVGVWQVCESYTAKRTNINHKQDETHEKDTTMTCELFLQICKTKLFPAIRRAFEGSKPVYLQLDNASSHTNKDVVEKLERLTATKLWCAKHSTTMIRKS
eukprot:m.37918 g.37918  ORF g.37918 m.37918 type:complete len:154 (+) comp16371_c0_seq1:575-1036(+)